MIRRVAALIVPFLALSGCSLLFPEDEREGVEGASSCANRVAPLLVPGSSYASFEEPVGVPTFTYDITKLGLEEIRELAVEGTDETAGTRLTQSTSDPATAIRKFYEEPSLKEGAFFLAKDPALYRVRGKTEPVETMIATGCARQTADMRLILIQIEPTPAQSLEDDTSDAPDTNTQSTSETNS